MFSGDILLSNLYRQVTRNPRVMMAITFGDWIKPRIDRIKYRFLSVYCRLFGSKYKPSKVVLEALNQVDDDKNTPSLCGTVWAMRHNKGEVYCGALSEA